MSFQDYIYHLFVCPTKHSIFIHSKITCEQCCIFPPNLYKSLMVKFLRFLPKLTLGSKENNVYKDQCLKGSESICSHQIQKRKKEREENRIRSRQHLFITRNQERGKDGKMRQCSYHQEEIGHCSSHKQICYYAEHKHPLALGIILYIGTQALTTLWLV